MREFTFASELGAPPPAVWSRIASMEGINDELGPWLKMTAPAGTVLSVDAVPVGQHWFRSWILFLGVIPVDYDDLTVVRLEPERGFLERSKTATTRVWEHERTLEPLDAGGTRLTDRVAFASRIPLLARLQEAMFRAVFRWRHRRLRRAFTPPAR
jgi:ligand-binding SRPBCC domain-containing protein